MRRRADPTPSRFLWLVAAVLAALLAIGAVRTLGLRSKQLSPTPPHPSRSISRPPSSVFAAAIRIPTVSTVEGEVDLPRLEQLHALLGESFPRVEAQL
ncbi:MAG: hypothetical protein HC897_13260, partial [Thermoanaerobaculia bacterium]|nr:hypothetical protein [Thermoanaerobaculia bacterium]